MFLLFDLIDYHKGKYAALKQCNDMETYEAAANTFLSPMRKDFSDEFKTWMAEQQLLADPPYSSHLTKLMTLFEQYSTVTVTAFFRRSEGKPTDLRTGGRPAGSTVIKRQSRPNPREHYMELTV